jgi:hypothetical protein
VGRSSERAGDIWWRFVAIVLIGLALVAFGYLFYGPGTRPMTLPGLQECRAAYAAARSSTDTAIIDQRYPASGPQNRPDAMTCGTLRVTGQLR